MFGFRYAKFTPGYYVFKYKKGKLISEGDGLSFYYYSPSTSIVVVKTGTADAHFMFSEITVDFQEVTVQGQLTYRVAEPAKTAGMLNHAVNNDTLRYMTDDPQKLPERLINLALVATKGAIKSLPLKAALAAGDTFAQKILDFLRAEPMVAALGIEVLSVTVAGVKPNAETARALESQTREQIMKESDDAVFLRRNAAIEQERLIRENELNTEAAVEDKNREIREKQMHTKRIIQEREQEMQAKELEFAVENESRRQALVALSTENSRKEADAKAYEVASILKAYEATSPEVIQLLANSNIDSARLIALAFQGIADKADKIGQLNISPDLLKSLMERD